MKRLKHSYHRRIEFIKQGLKIDLKALLHVSWTKKDREKLKRILRKFKQEIVRPQTNEIHKVHSYKARYTHEPKKDKGLKHSYHRRIEFIEQSLNINIQALFRLQWPKKDRKKLKRTLKKIKRKIIRAQTKEIHKVHPYRYAYEPEKDWQPLCLNPKCHKQCQWECCCDLSLIHI